MNAPADDLVELKVAHLALIEHNATLMRERDRLEAEVATLRAELLQSRNFWSDELSKVNDQKRNTEAERDRLRAELRAIASMVSTNEISTAIIRARLALSPTPATEGGER